MRPIPSVPYASSQGIQSSFIFFTIKAKVNPAMIKDRMINITSFIKGFLGAYTMLMIIIMHTLITSNEGDA
jgi:hypothetical protein